MDCFIALELDYIFKIDPPHPPLCIKAFTDLSIVNVNFPIPNVPRLNYRKANFTDLSYKFSVIDWPSLLDPDHVNLLSNIFYSTLNEAISTCVPLLTSKSCNKS